MDNPFCGTSAPCVEVGHFQPGGYVPSLAFHDVTGCARAFSQASLTQLPGVFGINRNRCSASAEISVRLGRKSAFGFPRNGRSFSPVLHSKSRKPPERRATPDGKNS